MMGTQRKVDHHHHRHHHQQQQQQHGVIQSSIALLQERFKQLQRVKEMREKRELLRIFSNNHNNNNNNNTSTSTTTTTTATISTNTNNFNSNNIPTDSAMQYSYYHDDGEDREVQVFLPPNYYNQKPWCHSSSSSPSSPQSSPSSVSPSSSSSSSSDNKNYEVSLSLWPSTPPPCNVTAADHFQRRRPCTSRAFKFEESHHVSDVDTTLHL